LSSPILGSQSAAAPAGDRDVAAISNYEQRRVLTGYAMDDSSIRTAVAVWTRDDAGPGEVITTYGHISTWDVSGVTSMEALFFGASAFNEDIGSWDTSGVKHMGGMFHEALSFNGDISAWDTSGVTTMFGMFYSASAFDQDLGWCVADDVSLTSAFDGTPCASTSCGVVQNAAGTCAPTPLPTSTPSTSPTPRPTLHPTTPWPTAFDGTFDDSNIETAVHSWFSDATAAESTYGHISTWDTSGVTDMSYLFCGRSGTSDCNTAAVSFNEDISAWDTSGVTAMDYMFNKASAFNQDIGAWDTSGVTTMDYMFQSASVSGHKSNIGLRAPIGILLIN
jgi:surface protein